MNPLIGTNDEPSQLERAVIKRVVRETALQHVIHTTNYGGELDTQRVLVEEGLRARMMACGYVWRAAERGDDDLTELPPIAFAINFMREETSASQLDLVEQLDKAVIWTMESFASLAYVPTDSDINADQVLLDAYRIALDLAFDDYDGVTELLARDEDFWSAFQAGIALREVEPYLPLLAS